MQPQLLNKQSRDIRLVVCHTHSYIYAQTFICLYACSKAANDFMQTTDKLYSVKLAAMMHFTNLWKFAQLCQDNWKRGKCLGNGQQPRRAENNNFLKMPKLSFFLLLLFLWQTIRNLHINFNPLWFLEASAANTA